MAVATSIRDRTAEFSSALEAVRPGVLTSRTVPTKRSDFTALAARVAGDINQTSAKLAKLTKLAQRRSLYDDPTAQIQELTVVIKQDLSALHSRLDDLHRLRNAARRSSSTQAADHSETVVKSLRVRLGATADGFKTVLKMRTDSLAAQQDRRSHFLGDAKPAYSPAAVALDLGQGSLGASARGNSTGQQAEQQLAVMRAPGDTSYQTARADAVRQVESTIVELGQIFNQLATMVSEQGELVDRIDANVEDTVGNMSAGQNQLALYYNSISGNRALILKVFGVLLTFLVLWTLIL